MKKILTLLTTITLLCASLCTAGSLENQISNSILPLTPPEIDIEPAELTLGMIAGTGGSVSDELRISNTNTDPQAENLEWNIEILTMDSLIILTASPDSGTIAPGQTQTVIVTWYSDPPITPGIYTADIIVHNNALPNGASDISIPITLYYSEECGGLAGTVTYGGFGLEGVLVICGNFQTYTDENGFFSFGDYAIPSGFYDVYFYYEEYLLVCAYGVYLNPGWVLYISFDIPLYLPPPENFTATGQNTCIFLEWDSPQTGGGSTQVDYVLDDGSYENSWGIDPGADAWTGNLFSTIDTGEIVSFEVYGDENVSAGGMNVWVDVFDSDRNYIGSSNTFVIPANYWTTVPAPHIPFSGDFYAMIHWDDLPTSTNYVGFDENGPWSNSNCDWYYDGTNWQLFHEAVSCNSGVFAIRTTAMLPDQSNEITYNISHTQKNPEVKSQHKDISTSRNLQKITKNVFSQSNHTIVAKNYKIMNITPNNNQGHGLKSLPDPILLGYNIYEIERGFIGYCLECCTSFMDEPVTPGTEYTYWVTAVYDLGESGPSNVASATVPVGEDDNCVNYATALHPNLPNPILNNTTFEFSLEGSSWVTLSVYNLKGQLVATLLDDELEQTASHRIEWDGSANGKKLANGIYFYKLETDKKSLLKKMVLMK